MEYPEHILKQAEEMAENCAVSLGLDPKRYSVKQTSNAIRDTLNLPELLLAREDRNELMKQFEYCSLVLPAALQVAHAAVKFVSQDKILELDLQNLSNARIEADKLKAANVILADSYHKEVKQDISKRLGHPSLEPWAAADLVVNQLTQHRAAMKQLVEAAEQANSEVEWGTLRDRFTVSSKQQLEQAIAAAKPLIT